MSACCKSSNPQFDLRDLFINSSYCTEENFLKDTELFLYLFCISKKNFSKIIKGEILQNIKEQVPWMKNPSKETSLLLETFDIDTDNNDKILKDNFEIEFVASEESDYLIRVNNLELFK